MAKKPVDKEAVALGTAARDALIDRTDASAPPLSTVAPRITVPDPRIRVISRKKLFAGKDEDPYKAPIVIDERDLPPPARWADYGFFDYWKDFAANETFVTAWAIESKYLESLADPNWSMPALDSPEWAEATRGIPEKKWGALGKARSAEQLAAISYRLRDEAERERRLMEGGFLPYFGANIVNPESLLLSMSTGGLSWVQKGTRIQRVMKFGAVAAGENVAQEAAIASVNDSRDEKDVFVAAAAGLILGGTFGAFSKAIPENAKPGFENSLHDEIDKASQQQAADAGLAHAPTEPSPARVFAEAERRMVEIEANSHLDAEEARLRKIAEAPNASADRLTHTLGDVDGQLQDATRMRDEAASVLTGDMARQVREEAQALARADTGNRYAQDRIRESGGGAGDAVFPELQARAAQTVAARRETAQDQLSKGNELVSTLRAALERAHSIRGAEIDLEQLLTARRMATNTRQRIEAVPERLRAPLLRRLDEADAELAKVPAEAPQVATQAPSGSTADSLPGFGGDNAGAARLDVHVEPSHFPEVDIESAPTRLIRGLPRFDYASILRSPLLPPAIRERVGRYLGDPVPARGEVSRIGATETAARLRDQHLTKVYQVYDKAFGEFLKETGANPFASVSRKARRAFGSLVTQEIKGNDTGSAAAKRAAATMQRVYADIGAAAKEAQVKGFENFTPDAGYVPRVPDRPKINRSRDTYTSRALVAAIKQAVAKGYTDLGIAIDDALLQRIADGYWARLNDLSLGIENEALAGLRLTDVDQIAGMLRLSGVGEADIADAVLRLRNGLQRDGGEGTARYAKYRTLLDEDHPFRIYNVVSAQHEDKSLRDLLFHDDAETLFQTYNHSMSGWIALAREAGIRSKADHQRLVDNVKRELPDQMGTRTVGALEDAYRFTIGQPLFDTKRGQTLRRIGRTLRDYQFARVMNMVGFANVSDAAAYLTPQYMKFLARHLPDTFGMFRRMQDGTLEHKLARQLEEWTSGGTDQLHNKLFAAHDDELDAPIGRIEHAVKVAARVTERNPLGIGPLTTVNQRLTEIAISQRLVDNVMGIASDVTPDKWNALGIGPDMLARIRKELQGGAVEFDSGKLVSLDFAAFKDAEVRDSLVAAIHRESRRLVQEEDFSETYPFMHSAIGKILIQFRRFGLVSYTKQFYRAAADRDVETLSRLAVQVSLGSLSYAAQMYLYSLTKGEEAQEWRDKYLTWQRVFAGGIARAGMFSLTPALFESVWQSMTGTEGLFSNTRTTGLAANLVAGVPALDFFSRTVEAMADVSQSILREDRQFDQRDFANFRNVLPFQNMIVLKQLLDLIQQTLPESDDDDDTEFATFPVIGDVREKAR